MTVGEHTPRRGRRRPGENRQRLIVAGIEEFARCGYRSASTVQIAKLAGVPQPHVYANFSTKAELFIASASAAVAEYARITQLDQTRLLSPEPSHPLAGGGAGVDAHGVASQVTLEDFFLHAVAALPEAQLNHPVGIQLSALKTEIGAVRFDALIASAADRLLDSAVRQKTSP